MKNSIVCRTFLEKSYKPATQPRFWHRLFPSFIRSSNPFTLRSFNSDSAGLNYRFLPLMNHTVTSIPIKDPSTGAETYYPFDKRRMTIIR